MRAFSALQGPKTGFNHQLASHPPHRNIESVWPWFQPGVSTRLLLSSTRAVFVTETTQLTQCMPQTVFTLSHIWDECKPLVAASLTTAVGGVKSGTGKGSHCHIENNHSTQAESSHPGPCVCMSFYPRNRACSNLGRVLVLNDPADWREHRPECFTIPPRVSYIMQADSTAAGGYTFSKQSGSGVVCYLLLRRGISRCSLFTST
jgi:muramidase (phage lysozyme)